MAHLLGAEAAPRAYPTCGVRGSVTARGQRSRASASPGETATANPIAGLGQLRSDSGRLAKRDCGERAQPNTPRPQPHRRLTLIEPTRTPRAGNPRIRDVVAGLVSDIAWDYPVSLSVASADGCNWPACWSGEWSIASTSPPTTSTSARHLLADHPRRWARNTGGLLVVTHDRLVPRRGRHHNMGSADGNRRTFRRRLRGRTLQRVERGQWPPRPKPGRTRRKSVCCAAAHRRGPVKPGFRIEAANQLHQTYATAQHRELAAGGRSARKGRRRPGVSRSAFWGRLLLI